MLTLTRTADHAASPDAACDCSRISRYCWYAKPLSNEPLRPCVRRKRLSGSPTGSGRHMTAFIRLKIAVLPPIPSASERVTAAVKAGLFRSNRRAYTTSGTRLALISAVLTNLMTVHTAVLFVARRAEHKDLGLAHCLRAGANGTTSVMDPNT